jgi:CubicO group peptidase (beta-lactamase class C family)
MKRDILCVLMALAMGTLVMSATGQETDPSVAQAEALFATCVMPDRPGGFSVAVVQDGQVLFRAFSGTANAECDAPITASTLFNFASVSKQFTGFAIATLIDQGRISLDDDIRNYLPEMHDFGSTITVAHLLHHTSGIRDWVSLVKFCGRREADALSHDSILSLAFAQRGLNFEPGERFLYSNTGYSLLAEIVARVTGQSFRDWTRDNIFVPLGMIDTFFLDDCQEIVPGRASAYRPRPEGGWLDSSSKAAIFGSSGLLSTVDDMAKWVANFGERSIGSDRVWDMMLASGALDDGQEIGYGFGLSLGSFDERETIGHGGSWAGTISQVTYFPDESFGYVFVANRDPFEVYVEQDLCRIFLDGEAFRPAATDASDVATGIFVDPAITDDYVGWYRTGKQLLKVERLGDELAVTLLPWELTFVLRPESDPTFRRSDSGTRYTFDRNASGLVNRVRAVEADGSLCTYVRMQTDAFQLDDVESLCGDYASEELSTTYRVEVKDGQLAVTHLENEDVLLARFAEDTYLGDRWWFTQVRFLRDEGGQVCGMLVDADQGAVTNLRFVKR